MRRYGDPETLNDVVDTLIEGQALLASSIYVDLVNLGLLDPEAAACRLRSLGTLAASPLHRHPEVAAALGERIEDYAEGLRRSAEPKRRQPVSLQLIKGGRP